MYHSIEDMLPQLHGSMAPGFSSTNGARYESPGQAKRRPGNLDRRNNQALKGRNIFRSYRAYYIDASVTQGDATPKQRASLALGFHILPFQGGADQPRSG
jgi:hypothetical protein